jgi:hypothetical protein
MNLSKETAALMYTSTEPSIKQFALDNYPELSIKPLSKSWDEIENKSGWYIDDLSCIERRRVHVKSSNINVFKKRDQCKASLALSQLSQAMAVYRGDWVADWLDAKQVKFSVKVICGNIVIDRCEVFYQLFSFPNKPIAELFAENFKDLILQVTKY